MNERSSGMDVVDEFLERYPKEVDYYDQVARMVARKLEAALAGAGHRAIVTSRAKSLPRLKDKLVYRNDEKGPYTSVAGVYADIVDLAGVRVALYFPGEREQVGKLITRLFDQYDSIREFPSKNVEETRKSRFSGYSAVHYRVRLKAGDLEASEQRYTEANVEIQVASVLMHAWSEVEHDLVYKPEGELSAQEYSLLDQLNGLVLAGEISLEQLQRAGEARVAEKGRAFLNHYDLAAHLLSAASTLNREKIDDSGLGRVDVLYAFLHSISKRTPEDVEPYLQTIHGNLEQRPLAEQIIDALLSEDESRYEEYQRIREGVAGTSARSQDAIHKEIGAFLEEWVALEGLLRSLAPGDGRAVSRVLNINKLNGMDFLSPETWSHFRELRNFRNQIVHGMSSPSVDEIRSAADGVATIRKELQNRL